MGYLEAGWSSVAVPKSCDLSSSFTGIPSDVPEQPVSSKPPFLPAHQTGLMTLTFCL